MSTGQSIEAAWVSFCGCSYRYTLIRYTHTHVLLTWPSPPPPPDTHTHSQSHAHPQILYKKLCFAHCPCLQLSATCRCLVLQPTPLRFPAFARMHPMGRYARRLADLDLRVHTLRHAAALVGRRLLVNALQVNLGSVCVCVSKVSSCWPWWSRS